MVLAGQLGLGDLDPLMREVRTLFFHAYVVVPVVGYLMSGPERARGAERVHRRLIDDRERAIAARETARESSGTHGTSFPGRDRPSSACVT